MSEIKGNPCVGVKHVVAVLEWNVSGHHPTYTRLYTRALVRQGCVVLALVRDAVDLRTWWAEKSGLTACELARVTAHELPVVDFSLRRSPWRQVAKRWAFLRRVQHALGQAERELGVRCNAVFLSCIYEHEVSLCAPLIAKLGLPWGGLYLQASAYRQPEKIVPGWNRDYPIKRLWQCAGLRGLLTLDEQMAPQIAVDCGRSVLVAPDITAEDSPTDGPLLQRVRHFRQGRSLVVLCGHLLPGKGVASFVAAALEADSRSVAFLLAGEVAWHLFDTEEAMQLKTAMRREDVLLCLDQRIPDGPIYNALVMEAAVVCAVYRDFPHSSNTLTKAAVFERPIIVADGHLMARRVRQFQLGEIVPQDDPVALLSSITAILSDAQTGGTKQQPGWLEYRRLHSEQSLADVLGAWCELFLTSA